MEDNMLSVERNSGNAIPHRFFCSDLNNPIRSSSHGVYMFTNKVFDDDQQKFEHSIISFNVANDLHNAFLSEKEKAKESGATTFCIIPCDPKDVKTILLDISIGKQLH